MKNAKTRARMDAQAEIFKALAHPTRTFIVSVLAQGEECVCKLTDMIGADKSTVSKHLSILRQAGIIRDERRANMIFYSLEAPCVLQFMKCIDSMIVANIKEMAAIHG